MLDQPVSQQSLNSLLAVLAVLAVSQVSLFELNRRSLKYCVLFLYFLLVYEEQMHQISARIFSPLLPSLRRGRGLGGALPV